MTEKCPCGQPAQHWHVIDGNEVCLCPECHVTLIVLLKNFYGSPVAYALARAIDDRDDNGNNYIDRTIKGIQPTDARTGVKITHTVTAQAPIDDTTGPVSIFVPLKENHNEIVRVPPPVAFINA